ncbi:MAG: glycosyltransferase, partial [Chloroflexi bacterium]|nr:glycosyltransferase [Chloroflexota bacterium]
NLLLNSNSYWSTKLLERLVKKADAVTVTNPFLQAKFGGIIVPNGRDTDALDPAKFDGHAMRRQLGLESARVVLFLGSPRKHKGIEDLIEAVRLAGTPDLKLLLVGLGADPYSERLRRLAQDSLGPQAILVGQQPWSRVPEFLAASDVVAIPQIETEVTSWQVPMKVFDAMAMGRPVVATRTSGLPEALEGCGWLVEPGKPGELAEAIDHVLTHPEEARLRGMEARERCIKGFSYSSMAGTLMPLVEGLLEKKRLKARAAARHEV